MATAPVTSFRTKRYGFLGAPNALCAALLTFVIINYSYTLHSMGLLMLTIRGCPLLKSHSYSIGACIIPSWDLIHTAQSVLLTISVPLEVVHVKSHQDSYPIPYLYLSLPLKLNIKAETLSHTAYSRC